MIKGRVKPSPYNYIMDIATFRFYDRLNLFLRRPLRQQAIRHEFDWRGSIKDMIESFGVPHTEIDLIRVNGHSVDFDHIVQPGDEIHVYPDFTVLEAEDHQPLRPPYPGRPRFVLDTHLGRLAGYLRLLGFDTLYRNDYPDDELAQVSHDETRILLTRDVGLLKRGIVTYGYYVRSLTPRERILEVMDRYRLHDQIEAFTVCMKCNGRLHPIDKADIVDQLQANTRQYFDEFHQCSDCARIYWKGSHYENLLSFLDDVTNG